MFNVSNIKLSVVIPCYNGWRFLSKCLRALETQTRMPYEVIIVDDCSTDGSYSQLQRYETNLNLIVVQNKHNAGPGRSREAGIGIATGNYLAFCDCDDWFEQDFVETVSNEIKKQEADLLLFDNYVAFENGKKYRQNRTEGKTLPNKKELLIESNLALWRLVAATSLFNDIVHTDLSHEEDAVLVIQLLEKSQKTGVLDKALYNYFFREGSLSKNDSPQIYKDEIDAFKYVEKLLDDKYQKEKEFIGIRYVCYSAVMYAFRANVKSDEIKKIVQEFEGKYPSWMENNYISLLSWPKRIYLFFVRRHMYLIVNLLSNSHHFLAKMKRIMSH